MKLINEFLESKGLGFLGTVLNIAVIFLLAWLFVRLIGWFLKRSAAKMAEKKSSQFMRRFETTVRFATSILKVLTGFVAIVLALGQLGLESVMTSLLTAAGVGSLVIGIGAQSVFTDLISGIMMLFEDQFAVGDYVTAAGITGTVESMTLRTVAIRSYTGELTVIPNGAITTLTNYSRSNSLAIVDVAIAFGENADRASKLMLEEASAFAAELGDSVQGKPEYLGAAEARGHGLVLRLIMSVKPLEHWNTERRLRVRIAERFRQEGIKMPFDLSEGK